MIGIENNICSALKKGEIDGRKRLILLDTFDKLRTGECWCRMGTGDLLVRDHTIACTQTQLVYELLETD